MFYCLYYASTITITNCTLDEHAQGNRGVSISPFITVIKYIEADICAAEYDEFEFFKG